MKFKVGGADPETDAARFRQAREAGGPGMILAADANQGYVRDDAIRFARLSRSSASTGSRNRAAGTTTAARCATCV